jgi:hypothetical protein
VIGTLIKFDQAHLKEKTQWTNALNEKRSHCRWFHEHKKNNEGTSE